MRGLAAHISRAALAVMLVPACASCDNAADAIPGDSLEGASVIRYPLGPYEFTNARKELRQGFHSGDGCGMATRHVLEPGDPAVQEIVIAEDPETCRFLVVVGEPDER